MNRPAVAAVCVAALLLLTIVAAGTIMGLVEAVETISPPLASEGAADAKRDKPKLKPEAPARDLSGIYAVVGTEKEPYAGSATVVQLAHDVYLVKWALSSGDFRGAGLFRDGVLSIAWTFPVREGGVMQGVHQLRLQPNGDLHGHWTSVPGLGKLCVENWRLLGPLPKPTPEL